MDQLDLEGIDHDMLLSQPDWDAMLMLAIEAGWDPPGPHVAHFRPIASITVPLWSDPRATDLQQIAPRPEAMCFARYLGIAMSQQRKKPPRWWGRGIKHRAARWSRFVCLGWEVVYLCGAGTVRLFFSQSEHAVAVSREATD